MLTYKPDPNNKPSMRLKEKRVRPGSPLAKTRMDPSSSTSYRNEDKSYNGENLSRLIFLLLVFTRIVLSLQRPCRPPATIKRSRMTQRLRISLQVAALSRLGRLRLAMHLLHDPRSSYQRLYPTSLSPDPLEAQEETPTHAALRTRLPSPTLRSSAR